MSEADMKRVAATESLDELYPILGALRMTPGWHKKRPSLWKEPRTEFQPLHWSYELGRASLDQAGKWIGTELAERRNALLFNPVGDNDYDTVRTLVAAYQMIKPGEYARAHRHSPNAMRLVLDAEPGCYTVVNGVRLPMQPGDFLLTPGGCWHSHYHEGEANAYWIDILDTPLVHLLEPMFFEEHPLGHQPVDVEAAAHDWYFPGADLQARLAGQPSEEGIRRLALDTQRHIPTVEIDYLGLEAGREIVFTRDTASRILAVTLGSGRARVGGLAFDWKRGDVIAVPGWTDYALTAGEASEMLEVSDRPVLCKLGFYRQGR